MKPLPRLDGKLAAPPRSPGWDAATRASEENEAAKPKPAPEPTGESSHARARYEAARLFAGEAPHMQTLCWIDRRCQDARMHALDPVWLTLFRGFYASGKMVFAARVGLRGAKSVSVCRSLVNDALFMPRDLDPGTIGVIPIMSSDRTEATDRFHTIKKVLRACGVAPKKVADDDVVGDIIPGGVGGTYESKTLLSGGGVIIVTDSEGHEIQFRIYPAKITGAVGYTGVAGFCDEVDLWPVDALGVSQGEVDETARGKGRANPADVVLDRLRERFTTTRASAHLYIVSASYRGRDSAHWRVLEEGDTLIQHVARLGEEGARRDGAARTELAAVNPDPRLLEPADPLSTNIPAWVTNPSKASILDCYALSRERVGQMLGRYGGRPDASAGGALVDIEPVVDERAPQWADAVVGVARPDGPGGEWGVVTVAVAPAGLLVLADSSGATDGADAAARIRVDVGSLRASVLAVASLDADRVGAELAAASAYGAAAPPAPVAGQAIRSGGDLRVGPLRTLYSRGVLRHVAGLDALTAALQGWSADRRSPRVEALAAAVDRLVRCYPWLAPTGDAEEPQPIRGRPVRQGMVVGVVDADPWSNEPMGAMRNRVV